LVLVLGVTPVCLFMAAGRGPAGGGPWRVARDVLGALLLGIGLSANNARAALEGLSGRAGDWQRTPKTGDIADRPAPGRRYVSAASLAGRLELLLAAWFAGTGVLAWWVGHPGAVPFAALLAIGLGAFGVETLRATCASRRAPGLEGSAPTGARSSPSAVP